MRFGVAVVAWLAVALSLSAVAVDGYKIGIGRADCTGPSVEVIFVSGGGGNWGHKKVVDGSLIG